MSLYLTANYATNTAYVPKPIPFVVDTTGAQGQRSSSTNATTYWDNTNKYFIPPVNGLYITTFSAVAATNGTYWINKSNNYASKVYASMFGTMNFDEGRESKTSSSTLYTTTSDNWYYTYVLDCNNNTLYRQSDLGALEGITRAEIILLQRTS